MKYHIPTRINAMGSKPTDLLVVVVVAVLSSLFVVV